MTTPARLRLDDDDPCLGGYLALDYPDDWEIVIAPRVGLSAAYNESFAPPQDWYGIFADDVVPETRGWDRLLIEAAGSDGIAFGSDGIGTAATHFAIGGNLARDIGWLALPGLDRVYIDTVWNDIGRARGILRPLPHVSIPHLHFSNRLAPMDAIYRKPRKTQDRAVYQAWRQTFNRGATA